MELRIRPDGWSIRDGECTLLEAAPRGNAAAVLDGDKAIALPLTDAVEDAGGCRCRYAGGFWRVSDGVRPAGDGLFLVERSWTYAGASPKSVALLFEAVTGFLPTFYMIPCVSYNGNPWGAGGEPKGLLRDGLPWVFPFDRTGLPSATFSEDGRHCVGLFASDRDRMSLVSSCSMECREGRMVHRILWPDREEPVRYGNRDEYAEAIRNTVLMEPGETRTVSFYIHAGRVERPNYGWTVAFDRALRLYSAKESPAMTAKAFWEHRIAYMKRHQWYDDGKYALLDMGLLPGGLHVEGRPGMEWTIRTIYDRFEIGWCGQNATCANALIYDYLLRGNEDSLRKGAAVLDTWAEYAGMGNGLFYPYMDTVMRGDCTAPADACNLGWGGWQMLEGWELAARAGLDKPLWKEMGLRLCGFFLTHNAPDGSFGKLWDRNGNCLDAGGTVGCYLLLPIVKAYRVTKDARYLERAKEMFLFYAARDLAAMRCTAGALDTHCVDKETCWPLLKTGIDLYEETGDVLFLREAVAAGYYLATWMFHFDAPYHPDSDFARLGFNTYGATSVSTQHHHLDPWGSLIAYDWLRLYRICGDDKWLTRFRMAWRNAMLGVSDGTLEVHGMIRPEGSQNEGFLHCRWGSNSDREGPGRFNDWLLSWTGAFKLLVLMQEKDWTVFDSPFPHCYN